VNRAIEDYNTNEVFNIIFTPFLFDNFLEDKIQSVFTKLDVLLKLNGIWLYADFINDAQNTLWQKILLKAMYLFFSLTTNIEAHELIDMRPYFESKYKMISEQFYYSRFIQAVAFRKIK